MELKDMPVFFTTIQSDVTKCVERLNADDDFEFWARMYIRSLASLVEGTAYMFRDIFRGLFASGEVQLTTEQQLFFHNLDWRITRSGQIETTEKKIPTKESVKCLFAQIGKIHPSYTPDFGSNGWNMLLEFYDVRDALLHPKELSSLHLSKGKILELDEGRRWLGNEIQNILKSFVDVVESRLHKKP